ncbi:MAG: DNA repair protein RecN [Jaaginema sp. PMC 1080.18]|nr:DNA repair protein RecN [Jaaginema sp. PMC 1080.18]MEC4864891.1 DNA repair protein RecN [Jaaginema sp. PMC 1078.18]
MLLSLRIQNFALIDRLDREFGAGLNVLTGETGAGKSIILDAIDLALGGKASSRVLRTQSDRGLVEATFSLTPEVKDWLKSQEIELLDDNSVVCSRELKLSSGNLRSRARINGVLVNRKIIAQLRDYLVEIAAQGQTAQLTQPPVQRELLDSHGGLALLQQREIVAQAYQTWKKAAEALENRRQTEKERLQRQDWLKYQIKELEAANLEDAEEMNELAQTRDRLAHVVELQQLSYQLYQVLYQNDNEGPACADLLAQAESTLLEMAQYDSSLESLLDMVKAALNQVIEAGQQINSYGDNLESDPEELALVEERYRLLKQICRKYGPGLADAIAYRDELQAELNDLTDSSQSLEELEKNEQACEQILTAANAELTQHRQTAASYLQQQLIAQLKPLAMEKVQFECRLTPSAPSSTGSDRIEFYFSPNPGEALTPLSETASGGEMSRFLLALKACLTQSDRRAITLIFDEIDVGVSGTVASAIAEKLHQLSQHHQVLCVTHQPLVAAMADVHFHVNKQTIDEGLLTSNKEKHPKIIEESDRTPRTVVRITCLDGHHKRRQELAQLAGGHSAEDAIAFAESLLTQAAARREKSTNINIH